MMRTEMACPDMEVEDTISVMLPRVATFAIEGDSLLKLANTMSFCPQT